MTKKSVQYNKSMFCLLLLVWLSKTAIADLQDESTEDLNDRGSVEDNAHLEHVTHAELVEERKTEHISKPYQKQDTNSDDDSEEEERVYNPSQDSFQDLYEDGTYVYGYTLPNGVTRFERSFFSEKYKGRVVEGFYTQPRYFGKRILYELRCYRADYYSGYKPLRVQYLKRPPIVRRDEEPDVDCFHKQ